MTVLKSFVSWCDSWEISHYHMGKWMLTHVKQAIVLRCCGVELGISHEFLLLSCDKHMHNRITNTPTSAPAVNMLQSRAWAGVLLKSVHNHEDICWARPGWCGNGRRQHRQLNWFCKFDLHWANLHCVCYIFTVISIHDVILVPSIQYGALLVPK